MSVQPAEDRAAASAPEAERPWPGARVRSEDRAPISVIIPNLHRRYSGITSMVRAFIRHGDAGAEFVLVGRPVGVATRERSFISLLGELGNLHKKQPRVWHARRKNELAAGVALRSLLHVPLKVVFTNATARKKTATTQWLLRHADAIIATSPEAALATGRSCPIIPHGVDTEIFRPAADRERAWASRGMGGRFGIGVFGRVRPQKGTDLFVDAMIRLLPSYPQFNAVVVGLARWPHISFRNALVERVRQAGLADRIRFVGEVPADDLPLWLSSVSICVAPQRREGFGLVPLEAAASGTPVVATRVGAAASVVKDGTTGLLVPPDNIDALTGAINRLLATDGLRRAMGISARQHALDALSIEREVEANLRVFRSVLN